MFKNKALSPGGSDKYLIVAGNNRKHARAGYSCFFACVKCGQMLGSDSSNAKRHFNNNKHPNLVGIGYVKIFYEKI